LKQKIQENQSWTVHYQISNKSEENLKQNIQEKLHYYQKIINISEKIKTEHPRKAALLRKTSNK